MRGAERADGARRVVEDVRPSRAVVADGDDEVDDGGRGTDRGGRAGRVDEVVGGPRLAEGPDHVVDLTLERVGVEVRGAPRRRLQHEADDEGEEAPSECQQRLAGGRHGVAAAEGGGGDEDEGEEREHVDESQRRLQQALVDRTGAARSLDRADPVEEGARDAGHVLTIDEQDKTADTPVEAAGVVLDAVGREGRRAPLLDHRRPRTVVVLLVVCARPDAVIRQQVRSREVLEGGVPLSLIARQRDGADVVVEFLLDVREDGGVELLVALVGAVEAAHGVRDDPEGEHRVLGGAARVHHDAGEREQRHLEQEAGRLGVQQQEAGHRDHTRRRDERRLGRRPQRPQVAAPVVTRLAACRTDVLEQETPLHRLEPTREGGAQPGRGGCRGVWVVPQAGRPAADEQAAAEVDGGHAVAEQDERAHGQGERPVHDRHQHSAQPAPLERPQQVGRQQAHALEPREGAQVAHRAQHDPLVPMARDGARQRENGERDGVGDVERQHDAVRRRQVAQRVVAVLSPEMEGGGGGVTRRHLVSLVQVEEDDTGDVGGGDERHEDETPHAARQRAPRHHLATPAAERRSPHQLQPAEARADAAEDAGATAGRDRLVATDAEEEDVVVEEVREAGRHRLLGDQAPLVDL